MQTFKKSAQGKEKINFACDLREVSRHPHLLILLRVAGENDASRILLSILNHSCRM